MKSEESLSTTNMLCIVTLKEVENIEAKGEIARFEQFLLLSHCFQKSSAAKASET